MKKGEEGGKSHRLVEFGSNPEKEMLGESEEVGSGKATIEEEGALGLTGKWERE